MKKILALGVLALMASSAHAVQANRIFRWDFNCSFGAPTQPSSTDTQDPLSPSTPGFSCAAAARVFANVHDFDHIGNSTDRWNLTNLLAVECGGQLFYANGALLNSGFRRVIIAGVNGTPAIVIPRHQHADNMDDVVTEHWMNYKAFLTFDHRAIPGTCQVRARPVRADETNASSMPALR